MFRSVAGVDAELHAVGQVTGERGGGVGQRLDRRADPPGDSVARPLGGATRAATGAAQAELAGQLLDEPVELHLECLRPAEVVRRAGLGEVVLQLTDPLLDRPPRLARDPIRPRR